MAGGHAWWGMCGGGGGLCMVGGVHGRGVCIALAAYMAGGVYGRGMHGRGVHGRGCAWWGGMCDRGCSEACVAGRACVADTMRYGQ